MSGPTAPHPSATAPIPLLPAHPCSPGADTTRVEPEEIPLSFAQERMWFLERLDPGQPTYHVLSALRLGGALHPEALARALAAVVARHDALRTRFRERHGRPLQLVDPPADTFPLPVLDLSALHAREPVLRRVLHQAARHPFDLERGPVLRTLLVRLGPAEHVLLVCMHHIISDRWSMGLFWRDLARHYDAFTRGERLRLPGPELRYADFVLWQRAQLQGEPLERQLRYWEERLAGAPLGLELPGDRPRPAVRSARGGAVHWVLDETRSEALRALRRREGATLHMLLLSAFAVLLGRYTGEEDLVVGTPVAGRPRREVEEVIGLFVNTLALRVNLSGAPSFR
ncbi:MAG TPA: condensation domain-containing protein, partial [Longimicrobiaceae bacterium]|nr:condensation domain-containing protein [Longimicrobiaceae bacterium]